MDILKAHDIIKKNVTTISYHPDYKRVCKLADLYKILITGENIDILLKRFASREDEAQFKQRCSFTQSITPSVSASIKQPFYKVGRVNNINIKYNFTTTDKDLERETKLKEAIDNYYGNTSLDAMMRTRFVDLTFTDPNAFIVTEFDEPERGAQGELLAPVRPRPFEVSCYQAINFKYENNILEWLLIEMPSKYGNDYTIYIKDFAVKYTQIEFKESLKDIQIGELTNFSANGLEFTLIRVDEKRVFVVEQFEHKSKVIPAVRIGYKQDLVTDGRTCVSPLHDAIPYFMKSIKTVSEFDLTMNLHAFPQKFQYVARCESEGCSGGKTTEGTTCGACQGKGYTIHASAQDAVILRLPEHKEDILNLEQLVHYEHPPIDLLKFQNDYITQVTLECYKAVYNSENVTQIVHTATAENIKLDSVYDTLFPYSEKYSEVFKHIALVSAYFIDIPDAVIIHKFPKDFKFKTITELMAELKLANESGAPGYVRRELSADIAEAQFIDKPEELKKIRVKEKFFPFPDKTSTEIVYILSNDLTNEYNKILYSNFDNIFNSLEEDAEGANQYFYDYDYKKQRELIKAKVNEMIASMATGSQPNGFNVDLPRYEAGNGGFVGDNVA